MPAQPGNAAPSTAATSKAATPAITTESQSGNPLPSSTPAVYAPKPKKAAVANEDNRQSRRPRSTTARGWHTGRRWCRAAVRRRRRTAAGCYQRQRDQQREIGPGHSNLSAGSPCGRRIRNTISKTKDNVVACDGPNYAGADAFDSFRLSRRQRAGHAAEPAEHTQTTKALPR